MFAAHLFATPHMKSGIYLGMEFLYSIEEINLAAKWLLEQAGNSKVIAFHGELGAGKTTLISVICGELGVKDTVSSPTFSIINIYETESGSRLYHLDLYRLKSEQEAIEAGIEECVESGSFCFVEWPERFPDLFTGEMHCYLSHAGSTKRKLEIIV